MWQTAERDGYQVKENFGFCNADGNVAEKLWHKVMQVTNDNDELILAIWQRGSEYIKDPDTGKYNLSYMVEHMPRENIAEGLREWIQRAGILRKIKEKY